MTQALPRRVHILGIGGAHMSAIAQVLLAGGHLVSGCDLRPSPLTERLAGLGIAVSLGHNPRHLAEAELVVTTAAVPAGSPELKAAARRGLPVLTRAEMVARLMDGRQAVCIAGSHGKSTTTALIAYLLRGAGHDPTFLVGAEMVDLGSNAAAGGGPHIVVEADEYAGAFLHYRPQVAVVTNIEPDHLDYYGSFPRLVEAFRRFLSQVPADGAIVACADDPTLRALAAEKWAPLLVRYALDAEAEWRAVDLLPTEAGGHAFRVIFHGQFYGSFQTPLPGRHNVANCLAAIAAGHLLGLSSAEMRRPVAEFRGVGRRFQLVGEAAGVTIMDDYAHHPTEVRATLATARQRFPGRRLVCLFQPHTYSRSRYLLEGFRSCFGEADVLLMAETYAAREEPSAGLDGRELAAAIASASGGPARYVGDLKAAAQVALEALRPGDVFFTIGAGDVDQAGRLLLEKLRQRC